MVIALLAVCLVADPAFALTPLTPFQFLQTPGPYPVRFNVVDQYDRSRTYPASLKDSSKFSVSENAWSLQTLVWYPLLKSKGATMTVGDYVELADREIRFNSQDKEDNRWRSRRNTSFDIPLRAVLHATLAQGHYPVVIYAPSDSSVSWENADLCEYLARLRRLAA